MHLQPMHSHKQPQPLLQAVPLQVSEADPSFCKQLHPLPPAERSTHTSPTLVQSSPACAIRVTPCQSADYLHEVWKFLEIRTSEITFAGFSGTIHQTLIWWFPGLPDLFHHTWSCCLITCKNRKWGHIAVLSLVNKKIWMLYSRQTTVLILHVQVHKIVHTLGCS